MIEIWKDVRGFEESYQVSNLGNVRSKNRIVIYSNGRKRKYYGQPLKKQIATNGYEIVDFLRNKSSKKKLVHRLVAEAFIPNPNKLPEVNHLDEDKLNNNVSNLEWCSVKDNRNYGTRNIRAAMSKNYKLIAEKNKIAQGKRVIQIDKNGNIINSYLSIRDAERDTGFFRQAISACCNGKYQYAYGYSWKFEDFKSV